MSDKKLTAEEIEKRVTAMLTLADIVNMGPYQKELRVLVSKDSKILVDGKEWLWLDEPHEYELGELIQSSLEGLYLEILKVDDENVIHMKVVQFFKVKLTDGTTTDEAYVAASNVSDAHRLLRQFVKGTQYKKVLSIAEAKPSGLKQFYITETVVFGGGDV